MGEPTDGTAYEFIEYAVEEGVATLRLQRPEKKNAINLRMRDEIQDAIDRFEDSTATVLILTGSGDSFSAGTDITELTDRLPESASEAVTMESFSLPERIEALDEPVIAMVNGLTIGGGFELALACDMRIASADAKFGFPEISLAGFPGEGGTQRLPRETNTGTALRLVLGGDLIAADRARTDGIVQEVHAPDELEAETMDLARTMADRDLPALVLGKKSVTMADRVEFDQGLEIEGLLANVLEIMPERKDRLEEFIDE